MLPQHVAIDVIYGPTGGSAQFTNRLYYLRTAGTITNSNISAIAIAAATALLEKYQGVLTDDWKVFGFRAHYIGSDSDVEYTQSPSASEGGVTSTEALPEADAVVLRRKTGFQGRDKRGRIFVTGVPETFQADGRLNAEGDSAYAALAEALDDSITAGAVTLDPCTPSFKTNQLIPVTHTEIVLDILSRRDRSTPRRPAYRSVVGA